MNQDIYPIYEINSLPNSRSKYKFNFKYKLIAKIYVKKMQRPSRALHLTILV